jgi:phage gpG-like protein
MNEQFTRKIAEIQRRLPEVLKRLPEVAKVEGLRFIADNFKNQGFETKTGSYQKWKKKSKGQKPTLIGNKRGGALRRSWQGESRAEKGRVVFQSSLIYAGVHNDGLKAGRPPGFTMPMRKMIGASDALDKRIEIKLDMMVDDVLKKK